MFLPLRVSESLDERFSTFWRIRYIRVGAWSSPNHLKNMVCSLLLWFNYHVVFSYLCFTRKNFKSVLTKTQVRFPFTYRHTSTACTSLLTFTSAHKFLSQYNIGLTYFHTKVCKIDSQLKVFLAISKCRVLPEGGRVWAITQGPSF